MVPRGQKAGPGSRLPDRGWAEEAQRWAVIHLSHTASQKSGSLDGALYGRQVQKWGSHTPRHSRRPASERPNPPRSQLGSQLATGIGGDGGVSQDKVTLAAHLPLLVGSGGPSSGYRRPGLESQLGHKQQVRPQLCGTEHEGTVGVPSQTAALCLGARWQDGGADVAVLAAEGRCNLEGKPLLQGQRPTRPTRVNPQRAPWAWGLQLSLAAGCCGVHGAASHR